MPGHGAHVVIARSPAEVFRYLVELHDARWRSGVVDMRLLSDSPDGVGARHVEVRRVPGRTLETTAEVVEYERDRVWTVRRATGPVRPQVRYRLAPVGERSTDLVLEFDVPVLTGPARFLRPVVRPLARLVEAAARRDLRRLRDDLGRQNS
jgi:hypothetical protein